MRKLLTAAALTGAAMMGPMPAAEAAPLDPAMCQDVYTDTNAGIPPQLNSELNTYKAEGIATHVQVLHDGNAKGIHGPDDTKTYAVNLMAACKWNVSNLLNIVVSDSPRTYAVFKSGAADENITQQSINNAQPGFKKDLQDTSTPYLVDVAKLLGNIDPHMQATEVVPPTATTMARQPLTPTGPEQRTPLQVPILPIGIGLAALGLAGYGSLRLNRGIKVSRFAGEGDHAALEGLVDATEKLGRANLQLSGLHSDDGKELRRLVREATDLNATVEAAQIALQQHSGEQRKRFWPDVSLVGSTKEDLHKAIAELTEKLALVDTKTDDVANFVKDIDKMIVDFGEQIAGVHATAEQLIADGWDIGSYRADLQTFDDRSNEVVALRRQIYAERPAAIITQQKPLIAELQSRIASLPERREQADAGFNEQLAEITRVQDVVTESNRVLSMVRSGYDKSCFEDINNSDVLLAQKLQLLTDIQSKGATLKSVRSLDAIEQSDALNVQFASEVARLESLAKQSHERLQKLRTLENALPARIEKADSALNQLREYAYVTYRDDVEDDVRTSIDAVVKGVTARRQDLARPKPPYLQLDIVVASQASTIANIMQAAQEQKREMDQLRSNVQSMQPKLESNLSRARQLAMHADAGISVRISSIPRTNIRASRQGLRSQFADFQSLDDQISNLIATAENNIAYEQQRREEEAAEQLRAIEAAAAAEAARQAAIEASNIASTWDNTSNSNIADTF